jgi:hypothetical protein
LKGHAQKLKRRERKTKKLITTKQERINPHGSPKDGGDVVMLRKKIKKFSFWSPHALSKYNGVAYSLLFATHTPIIFFY